MDRTSVACSDSNQKQENEGGSRQPKQTSGLARVCFDCEAVFQNTLQDANPRPGSYGFIPQHAEAVNLLLLLLTGTSFRFIYGD